MKSLIESLFDSNLTSKETGKERLYSWVKNATYYVDRRVSKNEETNDYFNIDVIKKDFDNIPKEFKQHPWDSEYLFFLDEPQPRLDEEVIRELLYITMYEIKYGSIKNNTSFKNSVKGILSKYINAKNPSRRLKVSVDKNKKVSVDKYNRGEYSELGDDITILTIEIAIPYKFFWTAWELQIYA